MLGLKPLLLVFLSHLRNKVAPFILLCHIHLLELQVRLNRVRRVHLHILIKGTCQAVNFVLRVSRPAWTHYIRRLIKTWNALSCFAHSRRLLFRLSVHHVSVGQVIAV